MTLAPIALFVYNRPGHVRRTVEALRCNELATASDLYVFSDGPRSEAGRAAIDEVRRYVRNISGFASVQIYERDTNAGLAGSIVAGVSKLCSEHGQVIVVEDDLVTSRYFLQYMNDALQLYRDHESVASIHAYCYPVKRQVPETFFLRGADCWGWATWERAWRYFEPDGTKLLRELLDRRLETVFDLDGAYGFTQMLRDQISGRNDSWAVRWHASCFLRGKLTLYPRRSLVYNFGHDGSGTHGGSTRIFDAQITDSRVVVSSIDTVECEPARTAFAEFMRSSAAGPRRRLVKRVLKALSAFRSDS
jgi:hypothetical protein